MSIATLQEKYFNKGCGTAVLVVLGVVMAAGLVYGGSCGGPQQGQQNLEAGEVARVNGAPIYAQSVDQLAQNLINQQTQGTGMVVPPSVEAAATAAALRRVFDGALQVGLARASGAKLDEPEVLAISQKAAEDQLQMVRTQAEAQGQLKKGATDAEFDKVLQSMAGRTAAEIKAAQAEEVKKNFQDPITRESLLAGVAEQALMNAVKARLTPSDAELKAAFNRYEYKRILFRKDQGEGEPKERATKARGEIVAKTLTFDQAMDRYSGDLPEPGKKLSESGARTASHSLLQLDKSLEGLAKMEAGDVSEPIESNEGVLLLQLVKVTADLPKDFEKNIASHRQSYVETESMGQVRQQIEDARKTMKVEWKSKGYQALYDFEKVTSDPTMADPKKREEALKGIVAEARKARTENVSGLDLRPATLAEYAAFELIYSSATAEAKTAMKQERAEVLNAVLEIAENMTVRLDLVNLYAEIGDGDNASAQLEQAALGNNTPDPMGMMMDQQIGQILGTLESKKLISKEQADNVRKERARWQKEFEDHKKAEAEQKAEEEKMRREIEAEAKKAAEEAKRNPAPKTPEPSQAPTTPAPGGSFLPNSPAPKGP